MGCKDLKEMLGGSDDCYSNSTVATENGKKFSLNNKTGKTVCKVKVDGCLIVSDQVKKCDYLFEVQPPSEYYLVELKGSDVGTAVEQIVSTFDYVNARILAPVSAFKGIIVTSAVPSGTEQKFRKLQEKYMKEKGFFIKKTHIRHEEAI